MSEHYDFHYQPTGSGAISGQQVLQQTEDAINELGDYVNDNVGGAMDVAQQALETAQNAEQDAQTALDTANSFSDAIQSAQQDASTALSTAQTAQTTASNANNIAIQAQQDANTAVTTANNASGQVSTLSGTVTALGQRVTTAEGDIGQNTSDITALGQRVTTAEGNITTLQNDVSIAQGNASSAMATAGQVKQQAYVFRYSSTVLVASSTNSNTLLDNTDNLKVGDKVIDSDGVLFSITAIDAENSTFTIGTALIDLAQDSDVVHKSGDETVAGNKEFTGNISFAKVTDSPTASSDTSLALTGTSQYIFFRTKGSSKYKSYNSFLWAGYLNSNSPYRYGRIRLYRASAIYGETGDETPDTSFSFIDFALHYKWVSLTDNVRFINDGTTNACEPLTNNATDLGTSTNKWKSFNGAEPSSLSLPSGNVSDVIDISSYITALNGTSNSYTVPSNGWISIAITGTAISIVSSSWSDSRLRESSGNVRMLYPVLKNETVDISVIGTALAYARFIPCQGNV